MKKRLLAFLIILCLLFSTSPLSTFAESSNNIQGTYKWDSPFVNTNELVAQYTTSNAMLAEVLTEVTTVYSLQELSEHIKQALYNRQAAMQVRFIADTYDLQNKLISILNQILDADDYLKYSMSSWQFGYSGYVGDVNISFDFTYLTTLNEELYVDAEATRILNEIIYPEMNEHHKVRAIHDYIVANVAYDTDLIEYSAYAALSKGKTVCQGYALLAFKLIDQLDIPIRIVEGTANGVGHAWNLVNLDGFWYHLDCTWDDPIPDFPGRVYYHYYNLTDNQIGVDHTWNRNNYPAASTQYSPLPYGIIRFEVAGQLGQTTIIHQYKTILFNMPAGTDIKSLTTSIVIWPGATISPVSGSVKDFTSPVVYDVRKIDGSIEKWTVKCQLDKKEDCNLDGRIDIDDLIILALSYGSKKGDVRYDSRGDITNNDIVDIQDLNLLKANYLSR